MRLHRLLPAAGVIALAVLAGSLAADEADPLQPWRENVTVRPVSAVPNRHTIHSYYLTCPESPDGKQVLFYSSSTRDGHRGELCVIDRATGTETVVVRGIETEDAHRAACQQWVSNGKRIAWHNVRDGKWGVYSSDLNGGAPRLIAEDRQIGFGHPAADVAPIYGRHWNPGAHRDLQLAHVVTGEIETVVTMDRVEQAYGSWLKQEFKGKSVSIFFPIVSPDQKRIFFKLAAGSGGEEFRTKGASQRQGLVVYDRTEDRLVWMREKWGHPAWFPDSRHILEVGNLTFDVDRAGEMHAIPDVPKTRGCHPSVSPDGKLFVVDGRLDLPGEDPDVYTIVVADVRGGAGRFQVLHRFDNSRGAESWRKSHPHPIFSADGRRIYFNVNEGDWTQLYVAEIDPQLTGDASSK